MKKCKYCKSEIDEKAKICPHCRKKQGSSIFSKLLGVILLIVGIGLTISGMGENSSSISGSSSEKITLLNGHTGSVESEYSYEIIGTLKNNTNREYSYIQVEFYTYNSDGNLLDTCIANNSGFEANGTWKFTASCFFPNGNAKEVVSYKLKEITQW